MLLCSLAKINRQDGSPFQPADFMPYAKDGADSATEADDHDPTVEETVAGFLAVLGAKKNG